ncbi:Pentatricopeptide repeat-containing protein [Abeliophyllum distichum]|uniref:Pentatricopeptide repeat-containing protein n=1 Tax=Abeliophyllum distichum TaxID=126358 RepID=A0ABD1R107_9LAMI
MFQNFRLLKSIELDMFVISDDEDEMSEGYFEAIKEVERMTQEPFNVLEEMNDKLSACELQLVLVYFSQEMRDFWCTLEVFEWMLKENKVNNDKMELMVSIKCSWMQKGHHKKKNTGTLKMFSAL